MCLMNTADACHYAVSVNQTQFVELMLAFHADPNLQLEGRRERESPNTPLQYAAELGKLVHRRDINCASFWPDAR